MRTPVNIEDAMEIVLAQLTAKQKERVQGLNELEVAWEFHFTIGLSIRNHWILNNNEWLRDEINNFDCRYADEYSSKLIQLCIRKLNGKSLNSIKEMRKVNWIEYQFNNQ